jgi:hypothetical protein
VVGSFPSSPGPVWWTLLIVQVLFALSRFRRCWGPCADLVCSASWILLCIKLLCCEESSLLPWSTDHIRPWKQGREESPKGYVESHWTLVWIHEPRASLPPTLYGLKVFKLHTCHKNTPASWVSGGLSSAYLAQRSKARLGQLALLLRKSWFQIPASDLRGNRVIWLMWNFLLRLLQERAYHCVMSAPEKWAMVGPAASAWGHTRSCPCQEVMWASLAPQTPKRHHFRI